jgi:5-methylcytosine-specific restriction endonuclease McrA
MNSDRNKESSERLDKIVAEAHRNRDKREQGYREKALQMYPWICGRCAREFSRENLHELTVHHRNHDHDYNPEDGSNWELLCLYCHDNEHSRLLDGEYGDVSTTAQMEKGATHSPFAGLSDLLNKK